MHHTLIEFLLKSVCWSSTLEEGLASLTCLFGRIDALGILFFQAHRAM